MKVSLIRDARALGVSWGRVGARRGIGFRVRGAWRRVEVGRGIAFRFRFRFRVRV